MKTLINVLFVILFSFLLIFVFLSGPVGFAFSILIGILFIGISLFILLGTLPNKETRWRFKKPMIRMSLIGLCLILLGIILIKALGIPYCGSMRPTKEKITKGDLSIIALALQHFKDDCERFPTDEEGLKALVVKPLNAPNWNGAYLTQELIDSWKHPYKYRSPETGENKDFDIWSIGPDGKDGTKDDIIWGHKPKTKVNNNTPKILRELKSTDVQKDQALIWNTFVDLLATAKYDELSEIQKVAYLCFSYDTEVQNGGHLQFLLNKGIDAIPITIKALEVLGANAQIKILNEVKAIVEQKGLKDVKTTKEFTKEALADKFGEQDNKYYKTKPNMDDYLEKYLKKYQDEFIKIK